MGKFEPGQKVYVSGIFSRSYGMPVVVVEYLNQEPTVVGSPLVRVILMDGSYRRYNERNLSTTKPCTRGASVVSWSENGWID